VIKDLRFAEHFLFTQFSLNTFLNCPLKFKKRYIENIKWENVPSLEIRKRIDMGNYFHLLANRYFEGILLEESELINEFEELKVWLSNLKNCIKIEEDFLYLPEYKLRY